MIRITGLNIGIEGYSVYQKGNVKFHIIEYRDPETGILHKFITTLEKSINPGTIAMLYFKRWTIEKSFNNSKSDLGEKKAWSSNMSSLNSQMRFTAMAYNIVRVLEEVSKANQPDHIHPSDKKYNKELRKRQRKAQKKGRFVNPLCFYARIVRISSQTIRALQCAIITEKPFSAIMNDLMSKLRPRLAWNVVH